MTSKAKKYSIISAILLLAVVSSYIYAQMPALAQNITSNISTTRYILFGGSYDVNGSSNSANSVFKLDTYTGNAWMLASSKDTKGKVKNIWVAVDNPPDLQTVIPEEQPQIKQLDDSND